MLVRLERANDEVDRLDRKIRMYQQQRKAAMERRKQVENEEIVKGVRMLKLNRQQLLELLQGLEDGTVAFTAVEQKNGSSESKGTEREKGDNEDVEEN